MRNQGLAERISCSEHNWNNQGVCQRCGTNYHVDVYLKLKRAQVELVAAHEEIASLRARLEESELHVRRIREKLKERC